MYRTGLGYDIHRLGEGRQYILGGVAVDYPLGFIGYSDGDVLIHAIVDAMLGACSLRDIGYNFPESSPEFKDISSMILLKRTKELMEKSGYGIVNIDSVVIAETPKLSPYIPKMIMNISDALGIGPENMSIKAKTNEGTGDIGAGKAVSVFCTVLLKKTNEIKELNNEVV